jgi:RNA recognition motif-containing protein
VDISWFHFPQTPIALAAYSMAWFVVGIMVGRLLPRNARPRQRAAQAPQKSGKGRNGEPVELYVGNLSYEVTEKDIAGAFEQYGKVSEVRLIENRFNGKSKGFGFVEMVDRQEAEKAIRAMNGREIKGRKIVVNEARSRSR